MCSCRNGANGTPRTGQLEALLRRKSSKHFSPLERMWSWLPRLCWFERARVLRDLVAQYAACTYRRSQTGAKDAK